MTTYADGIESGLYGLTSAQSTRAGVVLSRRHRFVGGGNQTWSTMLPYGCTGINSSLYIMSVGSITTSDRIVISTSAGQTALMTYSSFGSATGLLSATTVGLGTRTINSVSAMWEAGPNVEGSDIPIQVILSSVDTATDYGLNLTFRRPFKPGT